MSAFEFTFVVDGFDIEEDAQLEALYQTFDDVSASCTAGKSELTFVVDAANAAVALDSTLEQLRNILPNVRVICLDDDLVAVPDIATRTGRHPESIRLLANGQRGRGGFPVPVGILGGGSRIWRWADVCLWLKESDADYSNGSEFIDREAAAVFQALLMHHYTTKDQSFGQRVAIAHHELKFNISVTPYTQSDLKMSTGSGRLKKLSSSRS